jgi:asparagine synthase (glutamine-hydrolysing)
LGVQRLAINDLESGDQPLSSQDGNLVLICNGEIYNAPTLRQQLTAIGHRFRSRSDIEVILHLYERHGTDCLQHLRGMFAFALWDARRETLFLARDRIGIKPLDYALTADGCYFGSELKAILMADRVERDLDVQALYDLFELGYVVSPRSAFTAIRRLPPAHYLLYCRGKASLQRYWQLDTKPEPLGARSEDDWAAELREKLTETVRIHLLSDVPVGAWLSPGVDSSAVAALMSSLTGERYPVFSLGFDDPLQDELSRHPTLDHYPGFPLESHVVRCERSRLDLLPSMLWHCEDPLASALDVARLLLAEATAREVKVALAGEGSDELFGGYVAFKFDSLLRPLARLPQGLRQTLMLGGRVSRRWPYTSRLLLAPAETGMERYTSMRGQLLIEPWQTLLSTDLRERVLAAGVPDYPIQQPDGFEDWDPLNQVLYYERHLRLAEYVVRSLDRGSMAHSLEVRVPFLDHELVELAARIPGSLKLRGLREKYVLRRAMQGILPEPIVWRRKIGLDVPVASWLRGELPDFAAELLSEGSLKGKGYFKPALVQGLLDRHRSGQKGLTRPLLAVLNLQLWDELFRQGCRPGQAVRSSGVG